MVPEHARRSVAPPVGGTRYPERVSGQRTLLLALLLAAAAPAAAAPVVVFDRTSIGPQAGEPPGRDSRALQALRLDPRIGPDAIPLPIAWSAEGDTVRLEPAEGAEIALALSDLDVAERAGARLASRGAEAGEILSLLSPAETQGLLLHEARATGGAGQHRAATERVLTRGNVRDRWTVPKALSHPDPEQPPPALPAKRLLRLEVVSLGFLVSTDGASLPERFVHLGLRARQWNFGEGLREWDRALLIGEVLPADPDLGGAYRAAVERLLDDGVDRLAAELWPELGLEPEAAGVPAPGGTAGAEVAALPPEAAPVPMPERESLELLLGRLAQARLSRPPEGRPWHALAQAVSAEVDPGLRLALTCAEDPLGAAVDTGSKRLGLGLAETHRRMEESQAFRKALAEDLMDQVGMAVGEDWPLERAVRFLLSELAGRPALPGDAESAATPLLRRARLDGARSPESLAALLLAARVWPEGAQATLEELLTRSPAP